MIKRSKIWEIGDSNPNERAFIIENCKRNFYFWLKNFAITKDEHDKDNPFKPFPVNEYTEKISEIIINANILFVLKSRQLRITWLLVAYSVWLSQFHSGINTLLQGKKEDNAKDLIDRATTILREQPSWMTPKFKASSLEIDFPTIHSRIKGIPSGAEQVRAQTTSLLFMDEVAFMPEASEAYAAAMPSIKGGGKLIAVSTADVSWFCDMMEGKIGAKARVEEFEEIKDNELAEKLLNSYGCA